MTECQDGAIRDLLPDLAADRLAEAEGERVRAHLGTCRACAAEWRIVTELRHLGVPAPAVDPVGIAAAVRRAHPRQASRETAGTGSPPVVQAGVPRSLGPRWRAFAARAAAVALLVAGASVVLREPGKGLGGGDALRGDVPRGGGTAGDTDTGWLAMAGGDVGGRVSVSYGDLGDYSAEELAVVMERLDHWDGEPSAEPMASTPLLPVTVEVKR
ncbi:MAG: zf-HC2 domain-containing protein [Gemmatimonadetes bacterium]|nr:zf-HC2 domain-containing protein [Gemmatimonadota bacterium]